MCLPFPCSIWSQLSNSNKVSSLEISSRTESDRCFRECTCTAKKNRTLPPEWGRLITNSEFVSCLVAQRITGMLAGMSGLLPPSFNSIHSPICKRQLIKMIHRFAKLRHKWGRPPSNAAAVHLKNCRPFSKTQVRCTQHIDDHLLLSTN
jgi:hypothetical protein